MSEKLSRNQLLARINQLSSHVWSVQKSFGDDFLIMRDGQHVYTVDGICSTEYFLLGVLIAVDEKRSEESR